MKKLVPIIKITRHHSILALFLFLFLGEALADSSPYKIDPNTVYAIINANNLQSRISRNGLNAIFYMRLRSWNDGSPVTVFVLQDEDPLHKKFCKQRLNVFPHQIRKGWNKLIFSGTGQAPLLLNNKEEMLSKVSQTPGAVGYLSGKDLTADVKILEIE